MKLDKLTEATMLALQGKLIIKDNKGIAKKTESNKLPNTKNLVDLEHKLSDLITNTDDTEVLDILQTMERLLSKYLLDKHISF